jgi:D-alanyl-D-alanine dipeptidase
LKLLPSILIGASLGAIAIGGINYKINTMPCLLLSPGAKQMCQLATIPDTLAAAWSGFTIFGTITALFLGLAAFFSPKLQRNRNSNLDTEFFLGSLSSAGELYAKQLTQRLAQPLPQTAEFNYLWLMYAALGLVLAIALNSPIPTLADSPLVQPTVQAINQVTYRSPPAIAEVAKNMNSIAVLAIGHAEGNMTVSGQYTSLIHGHIDPSLIGGRRVFNKGWCSNYGRGGTLKEANKGCLERTQSRVNLIASRMEKHGLPPEQNFELFLNILDLWNQASPRVSDVAPKVAGDLHKKGLRGEDLILTTRVESFRDENSGQLSAGGLFNICSNPRNQAHDFVKSYPHRSEKWRTACIRWDQNRRATAIRNVLKYRGYLR